MDNKETDIFANQNGKDVLFKRSVEQNDVGPSSEKASDEVNSLSNASEVSSITLKHYLNALRPWSFTASITPVVLGCTLAYKTTNEFSVSIFITTCLTALSVHAAGNLVNTYYDFKRGIDNKKSDDRTLVDSILEPNDVAFLGGVFYIAGCGGILILTCISQAKMEHLALVYFGGLSSSFLYTGGLGLKYIAMGDIVVFFTFGPVTVMFAFLSQAGELSVVPLLYAIPLALNTEAILHSNNTRDMTTDETAGIVTLAIQLGETGSYLLFVVLLFIPYIIMALMGVHCSRWMFLPLLSVFEAFNLEKQFRSNDMNILPQNVAKLNLIFGLLYVMGCLLADASTLPSL